MSASLFSPNFVIGRIEIGSVEGASCINLGNNFPSNFHSSKKHNQGFGDVSGNNNRLSGTRSSLDDSDLLEWMSGEAASQIPEPVRDWFAGLVREASRHGADISGTGSETENGTDSGASAPGAQFGDAKADIEIASRASASDTSADGEVTHEASASDASADETSTGKANAGRAEAGRRDDGRADAGQTQTRA